MILAPEPPSGWPSAIAPPFGLSFFSSAPMSFSQASGTGANASLTSNTPMSSSLRPDFLSAFWVARIGAGQRRGVHLGDRPEPQRLRLLRRHEEQRSRAVGDLRGVACVDHAVLFERRLELSHLLDGGAAADALVFEHRIAGLGLYLHKLVAEHTGILCSRGLGGRRQRELVDRGAVKAPLL